MGLPRVDIDEMKRLYYDEHLTLDEVGKRLGISKQAVHDRLRRERLPKKPRGRPRKPSGELKKPRLAPKKPRGEPKPPPVPRVPLPPIPEDVLRQLYLEEGLTVKAIASRFACSESRIHTWMNHYEIKNRRTPLLGLKKNPLLKLRVGQTVEIYDLYHEPETSIERLGQRLGIEFSVVKVDDKTFVVTRVS